MGRISTPLPLLLKRAQYQLLPVVTMLLCASLAGWIWTRSARTLVTTGEVNAIRIGVESKYDGMLEELPAKVKVFDTVRSGQVIARIDTSAAEVELRQLEAAATTAPTSMPPASGKNRIDELRARIQSRDIKSPIDGTVVEINHRPGQSTKPGQPIMVIAANRGDYIVGYIRQNQALRPTPGMVVEIRERLVGATPIRSYVQSVGPQVEPMPTRHLKNPQISEWGIPLQIAVPSELDIKPGEMVDLVIRPNSS